MPSNLSDVLTWWGSFPLFSAFLNFRAWIWLLKPLQAGEDIFINPSLLLIGFPVLPVDCSCQHPLRLPTPSHCFLLFKKKRERNLECSKNIFICLWVWKSIKCTFYRYFIGYSDLSFRVMMSLIQHFDKTSHKKKICGPFLFGPSSCSHLISNLLTKKQFLSDQWLILCCSCSQWTALGYSLWK